MELLPIRNPFPGARSYLVATTQSTQAEARLLAGGGSFPPGSLLAAEAQTAGRGRFPERSWEAEAGKNLLFTIILEASAASLPGLPLRIGVALCAATETYALTLGPGFAMRPRLKWPNDLMIGDRKAAGVLCEAGPSGVFAGIGLNCNQVAFSPSIDAGATSMARELGREVDRWALLELFLGGLAASLVDGEWRNRAEALLWRRDEAAIFRPGRPGLADAGARGGLAGTIAGIDGEGSLLFRPAGDTAAHAYAAGELSRERPRS